MAPALSDKTQGMLLGAALTAGVGAALLVLAWFEGGERELRPIAEPVALPEQVQ